MGSDPRAAVGSNHHVQVVHTSFVGVVVQDDGWSPGLTLSDLSRFAQCAQEDHSAVPYLGR